MALILTISAVVVLIFVRLFMPPIPGLLKMAAERWGTSTTITLSAIALAGAVVAIVLSRH